MGGGKEAAAMRNTMYEATPVVVQLGDGSRRGAAAASLVDVVSAQLRLALEEGELQWAGETVSVLVAVDAPRAVLVTRRRVWRPWEGGARRDGIA